MSYPSETISQVGQSCTGQWEYSEADYFPLNMAGTTIIDRSGVDDEGIGQLVGSIDTGWNRFRHSWCVAGNLQEKGAQGLGTISFGFTAVGAVLATAGAFSDNEVLLGGGIAGIGAGGFLGLTAGALQVSGGLAQGIATNDWHNVLAGVSSLGGSVLVSRLLTASIPKGWHGASLSSAKLHNQIAGNITGALVGLAHWLQPKQVDCGQ